MKRMSNRCVENPSQAIILYRAPMGILRKLGTSTITSVHAHMDLVSAMKWDHTKTHVDNERRDRKRQP